MEVKKDSLAYRSGDAFLPKKVVNMLGTYIVGDDHTLFYLNYWSIIHFSSGFGYQKHKLWTGTDYPPVVGILATGDRDD